MATENPVSKAVRLLAAGWGWKLWRNNVGAFQDDRGVWVRYGLANESKQMNEVIKSSDLIGVAPVTITREMVGQTVGIFVAIETKRSGWKYSTNDKRAVAQAKYLSMINDAGGVGLFVSDPDQLDAAVKLHYPFVNTTPRKPS